MNEVYIAFGSNKGDRIEQIRKSLELLSKKVDDLKVSDFYETEAEGMAEGHNQPFLNGVICGTTQFNALELMYLLQEIEKSLGRTRKNEKLHYSREIDLDLLLFNQDLIETDELILPHPRMHSRIFVLKPLMDLNPELNIPGMNQKVKDLFDDLMTNKI